MGILQNLTGWHAIIILAIVLLLFGAAKLPLLAKSVGQSMKIFKAELKDPTATDATAATAASGIPAGTVVPAGATETGSGAPGTLLTTSPSADVR
jgi:sec-independent protein translocase protein TatA